MPMMVNTTSVAAAAAECHYQSGRYSQAYVEIQRCCSTEGSDDDSCLILPHQSHERKSDESKSSVSPSAINDGRGLDGDIDRQIILADDCDGSFGGRNDDHIDTASHRKSKPAIQKNDNNITRTELMALPTLAYRADLDMCQFRASCKRPPSYAEGSPAGDTVMGDNINHTTTTIHNKNYTTDKSNNDSSVPSTSKLEHLWRRAKQSNTDYRNALKGAAISLVRTASTLEPLHTTNLRKNNLSDGDNDEHSSLEIAMKSTALAILMAGVAASHLNLYRGNDNSDRANSDNSDAINTTKGTKLQNNGNSFAWKVLVNSAVLAADLMTARRDFMGSYMDSDYSENNCVEEAPAKSSKLEESLDILNETLLDNVTSNNRSTLEMERAAMAIQSFRTALKVAALSCGKVIIPTVSDDGDKANSSITKEPKKKRQKCIESASTIKSKRDIWSVNYATNANPIICSREKIVDALSLHYAANNYSCDGATLRGKRNICLEDGRIHEEQSNNCLFERDDVSSSKGNDVGWCAGYAWKMKHCLQGLDLESSLSSNISSAQDLGIIRALKKMTLSSSSKFACNLLGCIHAKLGDIARALEMIQSSLECTSFNDSVVESAQRCTLVNMALCFLALGEAKSPLELLLHLWMTLTANKSLIDTRPLPVEMLLTSDSCRVGVNISVQDMHGDHRSNEKLLWMLFYASSLSQDWATCLNCTEEISKASSSKLTCHYTIVARAFALLQCRRPSTALELIDELTPALVEIKKNASDSVQRLSADLLVILSQMYAADAYLLQESNLEETDMNRIPFNAIRIANKSLSDITVPHIDTSSSLFGELQILMANNQGVAELLEGDSVAALGSFRKATQLLKSMVSNGRQGLQLKPWIMIPTFFNLSLILLRDGHLEESAKNWLLARNHLTCWEKSIRGDSESLKKLRDSHTVAINRHVILMANRRMQTGVVMWDQETIAEWVPPSFEAPDVNEEESSLIGGVDAAQVIALDVILLRYAVSFAERKSSASFRRNGSIGY